MRVADWCLGRGAETNVALFEVGFRALFFSDSPAICSRGALHAVVADVSRVVVRDKDEFPDL